MEPSETSRCGQQRPPQGQGVLITAHLPVQPGRIPRITTVPRNNAFVTRSLGLVDRLGAPLNVTVTCSAAERAGRSRPAADHVQQPQLVGSILT